MICIGTITGSLERDVDVNLTSIDVTAEDTQSIQLSFPFHSVYPWDELLTS